MTLSHGSFRFQYGQPSGLERSQGAGGERLRYRGDGVSDGGKRARSSGDEIVCGSPELETHFACLTLPRERRGVASIMAEVEADGACTEYNNIECVCG